MTAPLSAAPADAAATQTVRVPRDARLELRWRLSLVIGLLLTAALGLAAFVAVSNARVAVSHEVDASLQTAAASLDLTLNLLRGRDDEDAESAVRQWAAAYAGGRHLCVSVESRSGDDPFSRASFRCTLNDELIGVPRWFARGAEVTGAPVLRHLPMRTQDLRIYLVADPRDESREAWADVRGQLLLMLVLALAVNVCVFIAVSLGLRPLRQLMSAMERIGRGERNPALPQSGAPEVQVLSWDPLESTCRHASLSIL